MTVPEAYKRFAWRVFEIALKDLRSGRQCNKANCKAHRCAADARYFLCLPETEVFFDFLGVSQKSALKELGICI